ncbi:MAG: EAL domain-containing protein [Deltaproteobacteria bacterium]|nr:EAL domain-containing protein [Deltaproteobacteria bacterium]
MDQSELIRELPADQRRIMRALADMGARLQSSVRLLSAISRLSSVLVRPLDLNAAARETLTTLVQELEDIDASSILLFNPENQTLELLVAMSQADILGQPDEEDYNRELSFRPGEGVAGRVFAENRPYFWFRESDEAHLDDLPAAYHQPEALACLPLNSWDRRLGVLNLSFLTARPFSASLRRDLSLLAGVVANIVQTFLLKESLDRQARSLARKVAEIEQEIAERKKVEASLRESEERHRIVLEASPDPVSVYDAAQRLAYVNPAFTQVFGWSAEEALSGAMVFEPAEEKASRERVLADIQVGRVVSGVESRRLNKSGQVLDVSISAALFRDSRGRPQGAVVTFQNITERKLAEKQLQFLAYHDVLTGLPNRKSFHLRLAELLERSAADQAAGWTLIFLDLDRFKAVNDSLGHDAGDELLFLAGERLASVLAPADMLFRLGGDEFTVILPFTGQEKEAARLAHRINRAMARPFTVSGQEVAIAASLGISLYPRDGRDAETLIKHADLAMYAAKDISGVYRFFRRKLALAAQKKRRLSEELIQAVEQGAVLVHYQPVVAEGGRMVSQEALARWPHPRLGLLRPEVFLPLAVEGGVQERLDRMVLTQACQEAAAWRDTAPELGLSVNLSPSSFWRDSLEGDLNRALADSGLAPERLSLEVGEDTLCVDPEACLARMTRLARLGLGLVLDNFGSGQSSLGLLARLPLTGLKIHASFVRAAPEDPAARNVVQAAAGLAGTLGLAAVAVGVENARQLTLLRELGCRLWQGDLLCPPREAAQALAPLPCPPGALPPEPGPNRV